MAVSWLRRWFFLVLLPSCIWAGEQELQNQPLPEQSKQPLTFALWTQGNLELRDKGSRRILSLQERTLRQASVLHFTQNEPLENIPALLKTAIEDYQPFVQWLNWNIQKNLQIPWPPSYPNLSSFFIELRELDLSNLGLTELPINSFKGTPNLEKLNLSDNRLVEISSYLGHVLPFLGELDIRGNPIQHFPKLGIFSLRKFHLTPEQRHLLWNELEIGQEVLITGLLEDLFAQKN